MDLKVPDKLNSKQRALLEQLALSMSSNGDDGNEDDSDSSQSTPQDRSEQGNRFDPLVEEQASSPGSESAAATDRIDPQDGKGQGDKGIFERIKDSLG